MTTIIFDLETRRDAEMGAHKSDQDRFAPPPFWEISTLAWCAIEHGAGRVSASFHAVTGEVDCLRAFAKLLVDRPRIVTWNGRGFDLPAILARSLKHMIPQPTLVHGDYTNRYRGWHVDLMDALSMSGAGKRSSQDAFARMIGLPGKHVGHGADVESMTVDEELGYCLDDVAQLALIHCEWVRLHGHEVEPARDAILAAINAAPRLQPLAAFLRGERAEGVVPEVARV